MQTKIEIYVVSFFMCLVTLCVYSQNGVRNSVERNTVVQYQTRGQLLTFINAQPKAKGSLYLYDKWRNLGVIEFKDGKKAITKNINYNMDSNTFESLFAKDSTHNYNFETINTITLNNKRYKQFDFENKKRTFEIIYEGNNIALLKTYKIHVYKASTNPMVSIPYDQYKKRERYFVKNGNMIEGLSLNKKTILKLLNANGVSETDVKNYVKENDLSFKNEFDVQTLLKHYL